jgi:pterin-4a-carbinolamine dehydratase
VTTLTHEEVDRELAARAGWRRDGDTLVRELRMRDFEQALAFVELIARAVDDYGRRPDMCIAEQNHVRMIVANPHHAGLTQAEMRLAAKVDAVLEERPPEGAGTR